MSVPDYAPEFEGERHGDLVAVDVAGMLVWDKQPETSDDAAYYAGLNTQLASDVRLALVDSPSEANFIELPAPTVAKEVTLLLVNQGVRLRTKGHASESINDVPCTATHEFLVPGPARIELTGTSNANWNAIAWAADGSGITLTATTR